MLLADEKPIIGEEEGVHASSLLADTMEHQPEDVSDPQNSGNWEKIIAESLDELEDKSLRSEAL